MRETHVPLADRAVVNVSRNLLRRAMADDLLTLTITRGTHAQFIRDGTCLYLYVRHVNPLFLVEHDDGLRELSKGEMHRVDGRVVRFTSHEDDPRAHLCDFHIRVDDDDDGPSTPSYRSNHSGISWNA